MTTQRRVRPSSTYEQFLGRPCRAASDQDRPVGRNLVLVGALAGVAVVAAWAVAAPAGAASMTTGAADVAASSLTWWKAAILGTVEGVTVSISDQATINDGGTALNLWQRNMFAVRAEIELGFIVRDVNHFVRVQNPTVDTP